MKFKISIENQTQILSQINEMVDAVGKQAWDAKNKICNLRKDFLSIVCSVLIKPRRGSTGSWLSVES